MSDLMKLALVAVVGSALTIIFIPSFGQGVRRLFTSSETVVVPGSGNVVNSGAEADLQEFNIVTLLGFDAILSILDPRFVSVEGADEQMQGPFRQRRQLRLLCKNVEPA